MPIKQLLDTQIQPNYVKYRRKVYEKNKVSKIQFLYEKCIFDGRNI
jgi:hypothetical protein